MAKRKILSLRPSQFSVGMYEVHQKLKDLRRLPKKELADYVSDTAVPVVRAPTGELYVVDRHHFLCVCWMLDVKKVRVKILREYPRTTSFSRFWSSMRRHRWCHLFDQFGAGPHSPIYLPHDVRGLADDPYRSLAWTVRHHGGYRNTDQPFAEFRWANFFRKRRLLDRKFHFDFDGTLKKAVRLARSKRAARLPGFGTKAGRRKKA